ncbi:heat shock protein 70 [Fragilariopsis cylindrus CCMP1102]|uniref:Heat shock protein 70 n=1 Tax=Fragilariopsis cylindrus CCMP1102 TaxID=635003 RepID=A0A1E7ELZ1_9STRA|nr:heat shock protein 70 [Fragilariopsis cylindrus CCMP1102]|eukprot:OEU06949.1 heat shock protein 70 [Fragilariopsis cylindrus CCMP1102]
MAMGKKPADDKGPIIGIDLGTTYSCVSVFEKDGSAPIIIANEQGNRITPSIVAFTTDNNNERLVGDSAKNQATTNPENTIYDVKRLIGLGFHDETVQEDRKLLPFNIVADKLGKPRISVTQQNGEDIVFAPEEISALVLKKMKSIAEAYMGVEITRAVITVPAYFNQAQREATKDAGRIAGLTVERIINEPTAAAIAYGLDQDREEQNILVFDLGGGTFDVTLLNLEEGVFDVLSSEGDTHLGGEDFDQRVMQNQILIRKEVERVKRALSSQIQARLEIEDIIPGHDLQETLTRARFEELNEDLFKKVLLPISSVLKRAGLEKQDVDHVVLVGGSTRIPKVQELLSEYFGGKVLNRSINPDEAVALGAAVQASNVLLMDKTSLSLGIETVGGVMTKIISRDTTFPTKKSQSFSTNQDNQSKVMIDVYEGERSMTKDNLNEAEEYAEEDKIIKDQIDSRNGLESYLYNLKNSMEGDTRSNNVSVEDKKELQDMIDETLDWMDANPEADKEGYDEKQKDVEQVANPIMRNVYAGGASGGDNDDAGDFGDDEL